MIENWANLTARRFHSRSSYRGHVAVGIVLLVALSCGPPGASKRDDQNTGVVNPTISASVPPDSSPPAPIASPTSSIESLATPEAIVRIAKGEQLYRRIASRTGLPVMFGWRAQTMSLLIPVSDWNKMTRHDQINLTYYAENLVREIRIDPTPYARRWSNYYKRTEQLESGMEYDGLYESSYIQQVGNLCYTCWDITIGKNKRDGFYDEDVPVSGTNVQVFRASATAETAK